jgi:hypothetical protein
VPDASSEHPRFTTGLIVSAANAVFEVLAEEAGIDMESPEGEELYDRIVLGTIARKAKRPSDLITMLEAS